MVDLGCVVCSEVLLGQGHDVLDGGDGAEPVALHDFHEEVGIVLREQLDQEGQVLVVLLMFLVRGLAVGAVLHVFGVGGDIGVFAADLLVVVVVVAGRLFVGTAVILCVIVTRL